MAEEQITPEQLKKQTADLSGKLIADVFEAKMPFVVSATALLTATVGYIATALRGVKDPQAREQIAIHVGGMLLKGVEQVMEAGGLEEGQ